MTCRLFVTYYREPNQQRRSELDLSLAVNGGTFDRVYVLSEKVGCAFPENADWSIIDRRQTYADLLAWASDVAADDDVTILANCDILVPKSALEKIMQSIGADDVYCLSRYETTAGGALKLYDSEASQDAWVFKGKPQPIADADFFGVPGCENRFAYLLSQHGYKVSNPSRSIKTIHVHNSKIRTETNAVKHRLQPPYLFVAPHHLGEEPNYRPIMQIEELRAEMIRSREIRRSRRREDLQAAACK